MSKTPFKKFSDVVQQDNVSRPFLKEHPEKRSREPRGAGSEEDRRLVSTPGESGATQLPNKSRESDGVLRFPPKKPEAVRTVDPDANNGTTIRCANQQSGNGDGNPKKNQQ
jgi:hypothetical protein